MPFASASWFEWMSSSSPLSAAILSRNAYMSLNFQVVSMCSSGNGGLAGKKALRARWSIAELSLPIEYSITGFSAAPLRVATWLGCAGVALCFVLGGAVLAAYLWGNVVPGWTSMFVALVFLGALQLLCLGLLGEYVARIFTSVQGRPAYVVTFDSAVTGARRPAGVPS